MLPGQDGSGACVSGPGHPVSTHNVSMMPQERRGSSMDAVMAQAILAQLPTC